MSPDPDVREHALDTLGDDGSPDAVEILLNALATDPDASVRGTAACNLGPIGTADAMAALLQAVTCDTAEHPRSEALWALRQYHHPDVLATLLAEIARPKRSRIPRQEVARQLGDYDDERSVEGLGRLMQDEDVFVRDSAAKSLLRLNRPTARMIWSQVLDDRSEDVRDAAAQALAELDSAT